MLLGWIVIASFYAWAIASYFRKWYALILAPVFCIVYFLLFSQLWFVISGWLRYPRNDNPAEGLMPLITAIGGLIGIFVGSAVGTAIGLYFQFRRSKL